MQPPRTRAHDHVIVGRDCERAALRRSLDDAIDGHGALALVSGEAGIGKTTLIQDLARNAAEQDTLVLIGHCYDLTTTPPYGPWLEIVQASPRVEGIPSLSQITSGTRDKEVDSGRGDELFAWGLELFGKLASRQPLLLILEDIHWSDRASLDFLRFLGRSVSELRVLVVATYRADEIETGHPLYTLLPAIVRESQPERIDLHPLDLQAMRSWIAGRYDLTTRDMFRLTSYLQRHAEGNPFFVGEILRELEEVTVLQRADGTWSLKDLDDVGVPMLLRQVLERRLERISIEAREALGFASVIGHDVDFPLWQDLTGLSDVTALDIVEQAARTALIELANDGRTLSFRHALIRKALYEEILPPRRRLLHSRIAEALLASDDPDPDAVAHHLQQAGDVRAGEWLVIAGDRAYYQAYSLQTAVARYEAALDILPQQALEQRGWLLAQLAQTVRFADPNKGARYAEEAEQIALQLGNRALEAVAARNRGINRFYAGQDGFRDITRGFDLLDDLTEAERQQLKAERQGQRIKSAQAQREMAIWYASHGRYREALDAGEQALALLDPDATSSGAHAAVIHWGAGLAYAMIGNPKQAKRALVQSQDAFRATGQDFHAGTSASYELLFVALPYYLDDIAYREACARKLLDFGEDQLAQVTSDLPDVCLTPLYLQDGRWHLLRHIQDTYGEQTQSVYFLFLALPVLADFCRRTGRHQTARMYITRCIPRGPATHPEESLFWFAQTLDLQQTAANLALDMGDLEDARQWIGARYSWLEWSGCILGRAEQAMLEARHALLSGDPEQSELFATEAIKHAQRPHQPLALLQGLRLRGEALMALGRPEPAAKALQDALASAIACRIPYEEALTRLSLAEISVHAGDEQRAQRELFAAGKLLEPLDARPALDRLKSLRSDRRRMLAPDDRDSHGLSERELEVLNLAAEGLTDREIGERLFISTRTVNQHMRSILNKLTVNSRTAAAVRGAELGLIHSSDT